LTVSVPSVDPAYSAELTDDTLTKSVTKTVLFQYSKIYLFRGPVQCFVTPGWGVTEFPTLLLFYTIQLLRLRTGVAAPGKLPGK